MISRFFEGCRHQRHYQALLTPLLALVVALIMVGGMFPGAPLGVPKAAAQGTTSQTPTLTAKAGQQVARIAVDTASRGVAIQTTLPITQELQYSTLKLVQPPRFVVDIPNASLGTAGISQAVGRFGIREVAASQHKGLLSQSVRVVLTMESNTALDQLAITHGEGGLVVGSRTPANAAKRWSTSNALSTPTKAIPASVAGGTAPPTPQFLPQLPNQLPGQIPDIIAAQMPTSTVSGLALIQGVQVHDSGLTLVATKRLTIKNRFALTNPTRLVVDFQQSALLNKVMAQQIALPKHPFIQAYRLGQFDDTTARLVLFPHPSNDTAGVKWATDFEEADPRRLRLTAVPLSDRSASDILPKSANPATVVTAPTPNATPQIQRIGLDNENGAMVLRLSFSHPITFSYRKQRQLITLALPTVEAPPGDVGFEQRLFPNVVRMKVAPPAQEASGASGKGAQFVLELLGENWAVNPELSDNKRTLSVRIVRPEDNKEIVLTPTPGPVKPGSYHVVVDAGHGGKDQGASRQGILEKDLNLSNALKLKAALEALGIRVSMTRNTDVFLPLSRITEITNGHRPDAFVSIHHNASNNPGIYGIETYYFTPQSIPLARTVHKQLVGAMGRPDRNVRQARFYVIHHTSVPAILCELGYVSNSGELSELNTDRAQDAQARAIAQGVLQFLQGR